jgi:hypothetical protein
VTLTAIGKNQEFHTEGTKEETERTEEKLDKSDRK